MTRDLRPTRLDDLEELGLFLASGFHADPRADFAAVDVMRWKFLDTGGDDGTRLPRSFLARDEAGRIIGHVGALRTSFDGAAIAGGSVGTLHLIDWLGTPGHPAVGVSLMRMAHEQAPTQYGVGGSEAGRSVIRRVGYEPRPPLPVFTRALRASRWLRMPGRGPAGRIAGFGRDMLRKARGSWRRPTFPLELRRAASFGIEVEDVAARAGTHAILTRRTPARLNHLLAYPRGGVTGWHLVQPPGRVCGFAVLSIVAQHEGRLRLGKVADLVLDETDPSAWYAAAVLLRDELHRQGADVAQAFAAPEWVAEGFSQAGFHRAFLLDVSIRDRQGLLPAPTDAPMHLTPLEADYAYT